MCQRSPLTREVEWRARSVFQYLVTVMSLSRHLLISSSFFCQIMQNTVLHQQKLTNTKWSQGVGASSAGQHPYEKYRNLKQFHFQRFTQQMHRTGFSLDVCICVIIKVANKLWGVPSKIAYLEIELRNLHILIYTSPYFWVVRFLHGRPCSLPCFELSMTQ